MSRIENFDEDKYFGRRNRSGSPGKNKGKGASDVLSVNIKQSMGNYSAYTRNLYRSIDQFKYKRS